MFNGSVATPSWYAFSNLRAEELLAVAAEAGHQAIAEVAQHKESISEADNREAELQSEVEKLREWQAAAAEGTTAAAEKLLELQQEIYNQEAQLKQAEAEAEAMRGQWRTEVQELQQQLEKTQQQRESAEAALAQAKREGEIKDQVSIRLSFFSLLPFCLQ